MTHTQKHDLAHANLCLQTEGRSSKGDDGNRRRLFWRLCWVMFVFGLRRRGTSL